MSCIATGGTLYRESRLILGASRRVASRENASSRRKERKRRLHESSARESKCTLSIVAAVKRRIEIFPANFALGRIGTSVRRFPRDRCRACNTYVCVCLCVHSAYGTRTIARMHARVNEFAGSAEANFLRELSSRVDALPPPRRRFPAVAGRRTSTITLNI